MQVEKASPEAGKVVLFLHNFTELWYSWRHQTFHLGSLGYRCVVPDLHSYGNTDAPTNVECYMSFHLIGDVISQLDTLGIHKEPGLAEKMLVVAHARQHVLGNLCGNRFRDDVASEELELPPWLTENDIDYFVTTFEKTGFTGGVNYYRNLNMYS